MSTVTEIKTAFKRLPEQDRWKLAEWIQEKMDQQDEDQELEAALPQMVHLMGQDKQAGFTLTTG